MMIRSVQPGTEIDGDGCRKAREFCTGEANLLTPHGKIFIYDASPITFKIQLLGKSTLK